MLIDNPIVELGRAVSAVVESAFDMGTFAGWHLASFGDFPVCSVLGVQFSVLLSDRACYVHMVVVVFLLHTNTSQVLAVYLECFHTFDEVEDLEAMEVVDRNSEVVVMVVLLG